MENYEYWQYTIVIRDVDNQEDNFSGVITAGTMKEAINELNECYENIVDISSLKPL